MQNQTQYHQVHWKTRQQVPAMESHLRIIHQSQLKATTKYLTIQNQKLCFTTAQTAFASKHINSRIQKMTTRIVDLQHL